MHPFAVPQTLSHDLTRTLAYWQGLRRTVNDMPFWDDVVLGDLGDLERDAFLIDAFDKPQRFRVNTVGAHLAAHGAQDLTGRFLDEAACETPFEFLLSQCSATVEAAEPTYFCRRFGSADGYARLVTPLWGDGRISMLLGVVEHS